MAFLKVRFRRFLWLFAVKYCQPSELPHDCPRLVYSDGGSRWEFVAMKGEPCVLIPGSEVIFLNSFLVDALHYLSQNPELSDETIHQKLTEVVRGKRAAFLSGLQNVGAS